jgi:DASH complex subunit DAD3
MDQPHAGGGLISPPELSPMEQEILEEYERLATNMKTVRVIGFCFVQAGCIFC